MINKKMARDSAAGYAFTLPLIIVMAVFLAYPIGKAAVMSFQYWYMPRPSAEGHYFQGITNYVNVFKDADFFHSLGITGIYIAVTVVARFAIGLMVAVLLNEKFRGRGIARAMIIIPWAIPEVVTCLVWILMYDKDFGIINALARNMGLIAQPVQFLTNSSIALPSAMAVGIWKGFPFVAIILLAGLQGIPSELYEAAKVDGAKPFQRFFAVTWPLLTPVSMIVFLLLIIWTIRDFGIVYLLARGGPAQATEILTIFIYHTSFKYFDFGKASAAGMIMLVFCAVFTAVYLKALNREDRY
ncbi:MAG: sugar ABC transporter permease [Treponema sp.]|jgi:multiple sugar transport system permease protein|nr:sugar ABC transporter permease [Treponema sp.]